MGEDRLLFALLLGLAVLMLLPLSLLMICTDLSGMFCTYKNGGIYWAKTDRRVLDDTPQNRRRISRRVGFFFLGVICAAVLFFLFVF